MTIRQLWTTTLFDVWNPQCDISKFQGGFTPIELQFDPGFQCPFKTPQEGLRSCGILVAADSALDDFASHRISAGFREISGISGVLMRTA